MRDFSITKGVAVTASDTVDIPTPGIGLLIGATGTVKVTTTDGFTFDQPGLVAGVWHPISVKRVWVTGTDAAVVTAGIRVGW